MTTQIFSNERGACEVQMRRRKEAQEQEETEGRDTWAASLSQPGMTSDLLDLATADLQLRSSSVSASGLDLDKRSSRTRVRFMMILVSTGAFYHVHCTRHEESPESVATYTTVHHNVTHPTQARLQTYAPRREYHTRNHPQGRLERFQARCNAIRRRRSCLRTATIISKRRFIT